MSHHLASLRLSSVSRNPQHGGTEERRTHSGAPIRWPDSVGQPGREQERRDESPDLPAALISALLLTSRRRATRGGGSARSSVAPWLRVESFLSRSQDIDRRE